MVLQLKGKVVFLLPQTSPWIREISLISGKTQGSEAASVLPQPVKTSLGDIQPARGIKITEKGGILLTAYRTNNQGDKPNGMAAQRLPLIETSCGLRQNRN